MTNAENNICVEKTIIRFTDKAANDLSALALLFFFSVGGHAVQRIQVDHHSEYLVRVHSYQYDFYNAKRPMKSLARLSNVY